jgi:hypothetical protein
MKKVLLISLVAMFFQYKMAAQLQNFPYCIAQAIQYETQANGLPSYRCIATNVLKKPDAFQWIDVEANNKVVALGSNFSPTVPGKYRCIVEAKCGFRGTKTMEAKVVLLPTPYLLTYSGLSAAKTMTAKGCGAEISASDLIVPSKNNVGSVVYGLRKNDPMAGVVIPIKDSFPQSDKLFFSTNGIYPFFLAAKNSDNKVNFIDSYVEVQEGKGCPVSTDLGCTNDKIPPMLKCSGLYFSLSNANGVVTLSAKDFVRSASDNCTPENQLKYRIQKGSEPAVLPATESLLIDCKCIGLATVRIWCGDNAGNWNYLETFYSLENLKLPSPVSTCADDKTVPTILLSDGFSVVMNNTKEVTISAADFIKTVKDNCSTTFDLSDARIEAYKSSPSGTPKLPSTKSITFKCTDVGLYIIVVWIKDGAGNWTYSESFIDVQDSALFCK